MASQKVVKEKIWGNGILIFERAKVMDKIQRNETENQTKSSNELLKEVPVSICKGKYWWVGIRHARLTSIPLIQTLEERSGRHPTRSISEFQQDINIKSRVFHKCKMKSMSKMRVKFEIPNKKYTDNRLTLAGRKVQSTNVQALFTSKIYNTF